MVPAKLKKVIELVTQYNMFRNGEKKEVVESLVCSNIFKIHVTLNPSVL